MRLYIQHLKEIGVRGVNLQIAYPLLETDFPHSAEYLEFYREVVEIAHRQGLKVHVETGPVFPDQQYSQVEVDFSTLSQEEYFAERIQELKSIAAEVKPDYLSIGEEPSTEAMLTGLDFSIEEYLDFVRRAFQEIKASGDVLVGAGAGSWENPQYRQRMIENTDLDFINVHIYPVMVQDNNLLEAAFETIRQARNAGKHAVVGESWLYKISSSEPAVGNYQKIYARDVYSFWAPLDAKFIQALGCAARQEQVDYVSFFWSSYLFGYLDYETMDASSSYVELMRQLNREAYQQIRDGNLSPSGLAYQAILKP
jgi:hypothetical protein